MNDRWRENGVSVLNNVVARSDIERLQSTIISIFNQVFIDIHFESVVSLGDAVFDSAVIQAREGDPVRFSYFYDLCQTNIAVNGLFASKPVVSAVAELLACDEKAISWSGSLVRMDVPKDLKNTIGWHQDHHYLPFNKLGVGLVVTVPLVNVTSEMGAVQVIPGSNNKGVIEVFSEEDKPLGSKQLLIDETSIDFDNVEILEGTVGSMICLDTRTVHRSGFNTSDKVRWSVLMRFHNCLDANFAPFRRYQTVL